MKKAVSAKIIIMYLARHLDISKYPYELANKVVYAPSEDLNQHVPMCSVRYMYMSW